MSIEPGEETRARLCDVVVVPDVPTPSHPQVATWRAATLADVDAITACQKAMDLADHPDWTTPREDIEDELTMPGVDLARDSLLALDADGAVLAWAVTQLMPATPGCLQVYLVGGVAPAVRGRGIGRQLLGWQVARGHALLALSEERLPGWLRISADEGNGGARSLAGEFGMREARWFTSMDRVVGGGDAAPIPAPHVPAGMRLEPLTPAWHDGARRARNDAFRDHWGSADWSPQRWAQIAGGEHFAPELSFVVVGSVDSVGSVGSIDDDDAVASAGPGTPDRERVLALALCTNNEEDWELQGFSSGYLGVLAVVRAARGRGLGACLLSAVLAAARERGLDRVVLDVDTESPTGALGLYERAGFVASTRSVDLVLDVG